MIWSGGCFCGTVRYQVTGPVFNRTTCHCETCRRVAGAAAVSWFTVRPGDFTLLSGSPAQFRSSRNVTRTFCAGCGTALTYRRDDLPDELDITLCSLDAPHLMAPADHTHTGERLPWNTIADGLPQYVRGRAEGPTGQG